MTVLCMYWGRHSLVYIVQDWSLMLQLMDEISAPPDRISVKTALIV